MSGYLLDTNVLSELTRPEPDARVIAWLESVDESLIYLSVLTLGEIRKGIAALTTGRRRTALESWLDTELTNRFAGRLLPIDAAVADRWGRIAGEAQAKGAPLPVIDGLLASTALHHHLTIASRNQRDFALDGLATLNPWAATRS